MSTEQEGVYEAAAEPEQPRRHSGTCDLPFGDEKCVRHRDHEKHCTDTGWTWFANRPLDANLRIQELELELAALRLIADGAKP